jgi:hypothetical protein
MNPGSFAVFGRMRVRSAVWRGALGHAEGIVRAGSPDSQRIFEGKPQQALEDENVMKALRG